MEGNGLTGLANLGNTCFINSCMQVLSHTTKLNEFFDKNNGNYRDKLSSSPSLSGIRFKTSFGLLWLISVKQNITSVCSIKSIKIYLLNTSP